jgi:hypothetical protein
MPLPEQYHRQQIENRAAAERAARRDTRVAWIRVLGEIMVWTCTGLAGIGLALHSQEYYLGMVYWWAGATVWVGGVSATVLTAYRRGQERGDW